MKYFKFTQISEETGISWAIEQPKSGPSMPRLPGLTNVFRLNHDNLYYIGEVDDAAIPNPDNFCFELSYQEKALELKKMVEWDINDRLNNLYKEEKKFRQTIFSKYDETATVAGIYKYAEAKELIANPEAVSASVRQEALIRGVSILEMANRIITNHETFRSYDAKIAGIRGKIFDRLSNFVFNLETPEESFNEFYSKEKIGFIKRFVPENDIIVEKNEDVFIEKYSFNIHTRFYVNDNNNN